MRQILKLSVAVASLSACFAALAQEHSHMKHPQAMAGVQQDSRQLVNFPPEMRQHTLSNMRDHLAAISEILSAMSKAQYARASTIADQRLGLGSPSAEGCKDERVSSAPQKSTPANMDHQMAQLMPEGMRQFGFTMHESASAFVREASRSAKTGNAKPALAALAKVTEQCAGCHAAYKVQ